MNKNRTPTLNSFIRLSDTPSSYKGQAGKIASVKADEKGLEFIPPGGGGGGDPGEGHITILPWNCESMPWGSWGFTVPAITWGNHIFSPGVDGAQIEYKLFLAAGIYTLQILGLSSVDGAIMKVEILELGMGIATFDFYAAVPSPTLFKQGSIAITIKGLYTLNLLLDGKNPGSGGHNVDINTISFWRTV